MSLDYFKTTCLVCGSDGMGLHFGVETCRACAAFFRRSAFRKEDYVCKFLKNCEKVTNCKFCRFKKCEQVGMKKKGLQNPAEVVQHEEQISYCVWDPVNRKAVKWIDVQPILRRSQGILEHVGDKK